jgi:hypothetical protein
MHMKMRFGAPRPVDVGRKLGTAAENRFLRECESRLEDGEFPEWVLSFRKATEEEDKEGVDVWVATDAGDIPLQIKRSHFERTKFLARPNRRHIACIAVSPGSHFNTILPFTISQLRQQRIKLLARTAQEPS